METAVVVLLLLRMAGTSAEDWPQWRGPNRDGVWHETGRAKLFPSGGLKISWRVPIGRGWSSPIVAGGRVYVADMQSEAGAVSEGVACFEETTGKLLWQHRYAVAYPGWALEPVGGGGPRATPIFREGKVYSLGAMGDVFCLDAGNGQVLWKKDLASEYQVKEFTGITASPLIDGDLLILNICGKPAACVIALDKNTGRERWRALDDSFTYSSPIILSAGGRRQLIVWTQQAVTSLNPENGHTWWRETVRTPGDSAVATPVFSDPWLLVGGLMLEAASNSPGVEVAWPLSSALSKRVLSNTSTAFLRGGCVFSALTSGEFVCLEAPSGRELWRTHSVTDLKNGASIHVTGDGDSVLLFTNEGNLIRARLSREGYVELCRAHLLDGTYFYNGRNVVWPPPAYANGCVLARNDKELVRAFLSSDSSGKD